MQKFCTNCGAELSEDVFICPNCGALPPKTPVQPPVFEAAMADEAVVTAQPKRAGSFHWWYIAVPVSLILVIGAVVFWQSLLMAVAPKAALAVALDKTSDSLAQRYAGSPLAVMEQATGFMENGQFLLEGLAAYEGETYAGQIAMEFNKEAHQTTFSAATDIMSEHYGVNVYMDGEFAAASLSFFNEGTYYGVTFDTFLADARKSLLSDYCTDTDLREADEKIRALVDQYTTDVDMEALLEPYYQIVTDYILALDYEKGSAQVKLDGQIYDCAVLTFPLAKENIAELCGQLVDLLEQDAQMKAYLRTTSYAGLTQAELDEEWDTMIEGLRDSLQEMCREAALDADVIFYVRSGRLVNLRVDATVVADEEPVDVRMDMNFGLKDSSDLSWKLTMTCNGKKHTAQVISKVTNEVNQFRETLTLSASNPYGEAFDLEIISKWNQDNGKLDLQVKGGYDGEAEVDFAVSCKLEAIDNGFVLNLDQDGILGLLEMYEAELPEGLTFELVLTCKQGCKIEKPEYINLDQWDEALAQELQKAINQTIYGVDALNPG